MNRLKDSLKNTFLKNVMLITGGTVFAQIVSTVLLPIITRLYSPEQYGVISIYASILMTISFLGSMNYEMGIPIAESKEKSINVLVLSVITLVFFTGVITLAFALFGDAILILLNGEVLIKYKYLIPVGILFLGVYNIFTQWAYLGKDFKAITKTKFTQAISQNLITIGMGILGKGPIGLILGKISGQSAGIYPLFRPLIRKDRYLLSAVKKKEILWAAKRYIKFPLYTTPRRFLGDITISLPILLMTSSYGSHAVGLFGLANSVIQIPMNLIGTAVSSVFYAESASLRNTDPKRVKELSNNLLKNLIIIGIVPLVILMFFGPILFSVVFGDSWGEAGVYASLLSVSVFSRLVFKPISNIFDVYEKQKLAFLLNIFRVGLVITVFWVSSYLELNSYWAVGLYSMSMAIIYFIQYVLAQKILIDEIHTFENHSKL
ncbi:oligosaccharide flippase family protein [Bacillus thuringiensis]|nr:oligosaccharide flippase family protein [Bacillus thuringiensis]